VCGFSREVEAALKQMERAEQTGDFNAWAGLWTREKSGDFEKFAFRKGAARGLLSRDQEFRSRR
jgi:hypothetical protein